MVEKIKIIVFGTRIKPPSGECSCGNCCESEKPTGILYQNLMHFLDNSDVKDFVDIKFIDLITDVTDGYSTMEYFINKGFGFPLTTINGELKLYGGISDRIIYQEIKMLLLHMHER